MAQEKFLNPPMPDVIEQWKHYFSVLQPRAGDSILDVGCNTGDADQLLLQEYPGVLKVVGIDNGQDRCQQAAARWAKSVRLGQLEFQVADASALPFADDTCDRAFCAETIEWVPDPASALREIRRVLKPGGVAVIIHTDFDTQVFNAADKRRCREVVTAFSDAGPNGQIGRELYGLCTRAGFRSVEPSVYTLVNTEWTPGVYGHAIAHDMVDWLTRKALIAEANLAAWLDDLKARNRAGDYLYSVNRYACRCEV